MRMVVDLPEPFGPKKPVTAPSGAVNDSAFTAVELEYRLVRLRTLIMVPTIARGAGEIVRPRV